MSWSSIVQMTCRQRAARAALALPVWQRCMSCMRLAWIRNRAPWGPVKREGKIKGPARTRPLSQSARGLGAARRLAACVPSWSTNPYGIELGRVPSSMRHASLRWSLCHGLS